ncbi:MAG TPA: LysR family transcriptional regulator [Burkholderiales bacterium]|nr:LysR family transcriptional regulator [Burkholderiales bacterium]
MNNSGHGMEDLERMAIFARVVEAKSFSAAARDLGMSKSLVSKRVSQLERSLGARLLNRTTRNMSLTEAGAVFYEHCARMLAELDEARLAVGRLHAEPRGVLRITAPVAFGTLHIAPALPEFLSRHPELKIDLTITDRIIDLAEEGYDLAVRITDEPAPNLVARRLAAVNRRICATPDYFARHGTPRAPRDLERHNCLTYTYFNPEESWRLRGPDGDISVRTTGDLRVNDDEALSQVVLGGLGIALLPTFIVGRDFQAGRLTAVLADYVPLERYIYIVYLPNRQVSAKVRVFIDYMLARIGPEPYWDRAQ